MRVKPSAQYRDQFPAAKRGHGTLVSRDGDIAVVQWDGGNREDLHVDFLDFSDAHLPFNTGNRRTSSHVLAVRRRRANAKRISENRKAIRAAFDKIRREPAQKDLANQLASCLGGSGDFTDALWRSVQRINADRTKAQLAERSTK